MNTFGRIFRISIYGTSHNSELGILIDGCPPGMEISIEEFSEEILRRSSGQQGTTPRQEDDIPFIKSGIYNGRTNGTPLLISFKNNNFKSADYEFGGFCRPGHADFAAAAKYKNFNDPNGGGQFSGRMTLPLVAAGVIAKKIIPDVEIKAEIYSIGNTRNINHEIEDAKKQLDSLGGIVQCNISGINPGLGEPFFDSVESLISHAVFSIPGVKAIEFGEGIRSASMRGSVFNDVFIDKSGKTGTNNSGGINGGITNGNDIYFRVYFRPASSIGKRQKTLNFETGEIQDFELKGRHDTCYVLRTPVIVEAVAAIVLADLTLLSAC
ncbi:MAG: chorismate synthase [Bacteroidales bacterium]|jgi:chorismate synthase|nr:chorismate synthase [Bacteroidales bacterium]